jgi:hypothetical protein
MSEDRGDQLCRGEFRLIVFPVHKSLHGLHNLALDVFKSQASEYFLDALSSL